MGLFDNFLELIGVKPGSSEWYEREYQKLMKELKSLQDEAETVKTRIRNHPEFKALHNKYILQEWVRRSYLNDRPSEINDNALWNDIKKYTEWDMDVGEKKEQIEELRRSAEKHGYAILVSASK